MRDYKTLKVWQKAHQLTLAIYQATDTFPAKEQFGLISQMRRSAASVPTNIAEGFGRFYEREKLRFISNASGSASELDYQLVLSRDIGYLSAASYEQLVSDLDEVRRMLAGLWRSIEESL